MCNVLLIYMSGVNYYQKIVLLYLIIQCVEIKSFSSGSRETPKLFVCDFFLNQLQSESKQSAAAQQVGLICRMSIT
jgi:hypothetical protein